jgi:hypothetical protein
VRRVAAVGLASGFAPLRTPAVLAALGRHPLAEQQFMWTDRNGDGDVQPDEAVFETATIPSVSGFDRALGIQAGALRYEVKEYLADGAPVYAMRKLSAVVSRQDDGRLMPDGATTVFFRGGDETHGAGPSGFDAAGRQLWHWDTEGYGVHALYSARPYSDAQVVAEFDMIGAETAPAGGLGTFFVTDSNTGKWHIWTADGILAGSIFRDIREGGRQPWSMLEHARGLELRNVTAGQEHFSGYFCRSMTDDKYYIVAGHNHISAVEVVGLDRFQRIGRSFEVTPDDLRRAQEWDVRRGARQVYERAPFLTCHRASGAIQVDGDLGDWSAVEGATCADGAMTFRMVYDDARLYVSYAVARHGPMLNTGTDWRRLFKTGAAVDLMLGVDPAADPARKGPAAGDSRILMTMAGGKPTVVLYRPDDPSAAKELAWERHTMVFRTEFDRVETLAGAAVATAVTEDGYVLEASLPLDAIGLKIQEGMRAKMDWGILESGPNGSEVLQRIYWANRDTQIVSDEAAEAALHPDLWGYVIFAGKAQSQLDRLGGSTLLDDNKDAGASDEEINDLLEE